MIWINGQFTENDFALSVFDKLNLGMSVFTTILANKKKLIWAEDHIERLFRHASVLDLEVPFSIQDISSAGQELLSKTAWDFSALRIQVTAGIGARGLEYPEKPTVFITCNEAANPANASSVSMIVEKKYRRNETDPLSRIKSGNYGTSALFRKQAKEQGYDDVIFLNFRDKVTCASSSNVILEKGGRFMTPPLEDGVMDGITRAKIMDQYDAQTISLTLEDLEQADFIWLANSFAIRPVLRVDNIEKDVRPLILQDWLC